MLHVLPAGIKRIRHYGLLASACKTVGLAQARAALAMPPPNPVAVTSAADFMARVAGIDLRRCPRCAAGRLHVVQTLPGHSRLPAPGVGVRACRGPP
jgi:hypothetical protein